MRRIRSPVRRDDESIDGDRTCRENPGARPVRVDDPVRGPGGRVTARERDEGDPRAVRRPRREDGPEATELRAADDGCGTAVDVDDEELLVALFGPLSVEMATCRPSGDQVGDLSVAIQRFPTSLRTAVPSALAR